VEAAGLTPADKAEGAQVQTRLADLQTQYPDLMVQMDGMDSPMRLADFLASVKAEADEMEADAPLMQVAAECALLLVIGAPNSSNSLRLVEVAERVGTPARLIQRASEIDLSWFDGMTTIGLTAGASAPEILVREVVDRLAERFDVSERQVETTTEAMVFKLPRGLEITDNG
jgi:hypothetical protein